MRVFALTLIASLATGLSAAAQEQTITLKPGPGLHQVQTNCSTCHSLDYIPMNSPFLNAAGWNGEVTKMIKAMGARIGDADAEAIVDYLAKNYGI